MKQLSLPVSLKSGARVLPIAILSVFALVAALIWLPRGEGHEAISAGEATALGARLEARTARLAGLVADTEARPLFHGSRRPVQVADAPVAAEPVLSLLGVISDSGAEIALLRISTGPELYRVGKGDTVGQWRVLDIGPEAVEVSKDGTDPVTLRID